MLKFYDTFEVDDLKGTSMTTKDVTGSHYNKIQALQKEIFRRFNSENYPELRRFALTNVGAVDRRAELRKGMGYYSIVSSSAEKSNRTYIQVL